MKIDIFGLTIEELQEVLVSKGLKKFRAKQIFQWLYQKSVFDFSAMHNLSKADIAILEENFTVLPREITILREQNSSDGLTSKLLLGLPDGNSVRLLRQRSQGSGAQFIRCGNNCSGLPFQ